VKFELYHPQAKANDQFEHGTSIVKKTATTLRPCRICGSLTRWKEVLCQVPICSQECATNVLEHYRNYCISSGTKNVDQQLEQMKIELQIAERTSPPSTDILIVVKDQLQYLKECIASIEETTVNFTLYIWNNGSNSETCQYLEGLKQKDYPVHVVHHNENIGFIVPNNRLAKMGTSEYIILLNSDCKVYELWQKLLVGFLQEYSDVAEVGFWGGHVGVDGRGFGGTNGYNVDYIPGWCFCISRETYNKFGLFDEEHLNFAYCEDLDFSLRLKSAGKKIYALYSPSVHHHQNVTIKDVWKEGKIDVHASFVHNHAWIAEHWKDYLDCQRVSKSPPKDVDS
jgi:GT2 family glycosyltransferase/endogenous inhibitor of DNA gyrase (YacG/DUF329 family)